MVGDEPGLLEMLMGPPSREEFISVTAQLLGDWTSLLSILVAKGIVKEEEIETLKIMSDQYIDQVRTACRRKTLRNFRKFAKEDEDFAELFSDEYDSEIDEEEE